MKSGVGFQYLRNDHANVLVKLLDKDIQENEEFSIVTGDFNEIPTGEPIVKYLKS